MESNSDPVHHCSRIPLVIVASRIICAPFLFVWYIAQLQIGVITLFIILVFTDFLDGYIARRLKIASSSALVAYLDSLADFIVICFMFLAFIVTQVYPVWLMVIIGLLYLQFIFTSGWRHPHYDPVGKYTGLFLFGIILVTLVFPNLTVYYASTWGIIGFAVFALSSRVIFLWQSTKNK